MTKINTNKQIEQHAKMWADVHNSLQRAYKLPIPSRQQLCDAVYHYVVNTEATKHFKVFQYEYFLRCVECEVTVFMKAS